MKRLYSGIVALVALAGCGGGGAAPTVGPATRATKREILKAVEQGFASKQQGVVPDASGRTRAERLAAYNEYYELWAVSVDGGVDYFADTELTQPAGKMRYSYSTGEAGEFTKSSTIEITAGPQKGYTETVNVVQDSTGVRFEFQGNSQVNGPFITTGSTINGVTVIKNGFRDELGNVRYYDIEYAGDDTVKVTYNSEKLFNFELRYSADGTGAGTVTGSSELLPATLEWDRLGAGTIVFKDGSTQSFANFRFEF